LAAQDFSHWSFFTKCNKWAQLWMIYCFVQALNACASLQGLEEGRHMHGLIMQSGCESNLYVGSSLVDMYANCGGIEDA
jgi:hypothetical protein